MFHSSLSSYRLDKNRDIRHNRACHAGTRWVEPAYKQQLEAWRPPVHSRHATEADRCSVERRVLDAGRAPGREKPDLFTSRVSVGSRLERDTKRKREREWSFQAPFSIVGSPKRFFGVQWRNLFFFFFFFLVHVESDSKKRNRIFVRGFWTRLDLESLVHRFELIWSNSRSPFSTFFRWLIEV